MNQEAASANNIISSGYTLATNAPAECNELYTAGHSDAVTQLCALPLQKIWGDCPYNGGSVGNACGSWWMQTVSCLHILLLDVYARSARLTYVVGSVRLRLPVRWAVRAVPPVAGLLLNPANENSRESPSNSDCQMHPEMPCCRSRSAFTLSISVG